MLADHRSTPSLDVLKLSKPSVLHTRLRLSDLLFCYDGPRQCNLQHKNHMTKDGNTLGKTLQLTGQKNRSVLTKSTKVYDTPQQQLSQYAACPPSLSRSRKSIPSDCNSVLSPPSLTQRLQVHGVSMSTTSHPLPNKVRASRAGGGRVILDIPDDSAHCYLNRPELPPGRQVLSNRSVQKSWKTYDNNFLNYKTNGAQHIENWHDILMKTTKQKMPCNQHKSTKNNSSTTREASPVVTDTDSPGPSDDTHVKGILKSSSQCTISLSASRDLQSISESYNRSSTRSQKRVQFQEVNNPHAGRFVDEFSQDLSFEFSPDTPTPSVVNDKRDVDIFTVNHIEQVADINGFAGCPDEPFPFHRDDGGFTPESLLTRDVLLFTDYVNERSPTKTKLSRKSLPNLDVRENSKVSRKSARNGTKVRNSNISSKSQRLATLSKTVRSEDSESKESCNKTTCFTSKSANEVNLAPRPCQTKSETLVAENPKRSFKEIKASLRSTASKTKKATADEQIKTVAESNRHSKTNSVIPAFSRTTSNGHDHDTPSLEAGLDCMPVSRIFVKRKTSEPRSVPTDVLPSDDKTLRIIKWLYEMDPCPQRLEADFPRTKAVRHPGVGLQ